MPRTRTLFIVGAGASCEAGLPSGAELKQAIADLVDIRYEDGYHLSHGDAAIVSAVQHHVKLATTNERNLNNYFGFGREIAAGLPLALSIDNYLDAHRDNPTLTFMGKLAIVRSILDAERNSILWSDPHRSSSRNDFNPLLNTWFVRLWTLMSESVPRVESERMMQNVSFIVFNYDRCIELFLMRAAQTYYSIGEKEARDLVSRLSIYHPYGTVGRLPNFNGVTEGVPFGETPRVPQLLDAASQIRTFTEQIEENDSLRAMRQEVAQAARIVFLGFGFHKQNLQLLKPEKEGATKAVFATAKGFSDSDRKVVTTEIKNLLGMPATSAVEVAPLSCVELFRDYWRSLSLA